MGRKYAGAGNDLHKDVQTGQELFKQALDGMRALRDWSDEFTRRWEHRLGPEGPSDAVLAERERVLTLVREAVARSSDLMPKVLGKNPPKRAYGNYLYSPFLEGIEKRVNAEADAPAKD